MVDLCVQPSCIIAVCISKKAVTHELILKNREFGLNIVDESLKDGSFLCGTCSGRDVNKPVKFAMALAPYAPNAVMAGFICCALGEFSGVLILVLSSSPVLIIPSFIPVFFDAAITAVFADTFGGWKALVVISFCVGLIHIFGNLWAAKNSGLVGGWMGNSDWATIWPLIMEGMKAISPIR